MPNHHVNLATLSFKSIVSAFVLSLFNLLAINHSFAKDLLLEGKCAIPELRQSFPACTILNDGKSLIILTGRNQFLQRKVPISDITLAGQLGTRFEANSQLLKENITQSLSEINTSLSDAQKSNNVRAFQFETSKLILTLILIADRTQKNIDEISQLIPTIDRKDSANADLAPAEAREILEDFERKFERAQTLYENLMFEEADRVLDLAIAKKNLFTKSYGNREGVKEVSNLLNSQIKQLLSLREYKTYDRMVEEQIAEKNYDQAQRRLAEAEEKRRKYQYKMAVEYRKTAEANAVSWYSFWLGRPRTSIYIIR